MDNIIGGIGIMSGYGMHVRQLKLDDVQTYGVQLGDIPIEECVAVFGEDLGEALAAVVHLKKDSPRPLVWSDADGRGKPISDAFKFADAVAVTLTAIFPHLS